MALTRPGSWPLEPSPCLICSKNPYILCSFRVLQGQTKVPSMGRDMMRVILSTCAQQHHAGPPSRAALRGPWGTCAARQPALRGASASCRRPCVRYAWRAAPAPQPGPARWRTIWRPPALRGRELRQGPMQRSVALGCRASWAHLGHAHWRTTWRLPALCLGPAPSSCLRASRPACFQARRTSPGQARALRRPAWQAPVRHQQTAVLRGYQHVGARLGAGLRLQAEPMASYPRRADPPRQPRVPLLVDARSACSLRCRPCAGCRRQSL